MNDFNVIQEPPSLPVGMKIVGTGVILSCLMLAVLFGWGIYLNMGSSGRMEIKPPEPTDDVAIELGLLTRINPPAFTIEIPDGMQHRQRTTGQLYSGGRSVSPFSLQVAVFEVGEEGFEAWVKQSGETWTKSFESLGSKSVEIKRSVPIDRYKGFKAYEMEIIWLWTDGNTKLKNI